MFFINFRSFKLLISNESFTLLSIIINQFGSMTAERTREQRCSPVSKKNYYYSISVSLCLNDTLWYLDDASACLSEHKQWHRFRTERHIGHIWRVLCTYAAAPHDSSSDDMLSPLLEGSARARRSGHSRKKPKNHIPRPPNVFILFCSSLIKSQRVESLLRSRLTGPQSPL